MANPNFAEYNTHFTVSQVGASGWGSPVGHSNQAFMIGGDDHTYTVTYDAEGSICVLDVTSGAFQRISGSQIVTDMAAVGLTPFTTVDSHFAVAGTPYFWYIGQSPGTLRLNIAAVMYKINSISSIVPVSGINGKTSQFGSGTRYLSNDNATSIAVVSDGTEVVMMGQVGDGFLAGPSQTSYITLPLTEGWLTTNENWDDRWTTLAALGDNFFQFGSTNARATILDTSPLQAIIYIGPHNLAYMQAHPGFNTVWDTITSRAVLSLDMVSGGLTDITTQFDFTDAGKNLDGSSAGSVIACDYRAPNAFIQNGTQFLAFCRTYTGADLGAKGSLFRCKLYKLQSGSWDATIDFSLSLFDIVGDIGVGAGSVDNFPADNLQVYAIDNQHLGYMWEQNEFIGGLGMYIFGGITVPGGLSGDLLVGTFASFHDNTYTDWNSTSPSDFTSELTTYYMLSDGSSVFMEAPWVFTFVENVAEASLPALTLQPIWDWSDNPSNVKYASPSECYISKPGSLVLDRKHRVRGKGRALQLKFISETGKPFNLLGWSIHTDANAQP